MIVYRIKGKGFQGMRVIDGVAEVIKFADEKLASYTLTGKTFQLSHEQTAFLSDKTKAEVIINAVEA